MIVDERKLKILKIIIDDFIDTAQPVGSRTIAKKYPIGISSATIRNEMADLEDLGYLMQPHTSAGRVPSDQGYRLYVDSLVNQKALELDQRELVRKLLLNNLIEAEDIARQATKLLASLTGLTAMVTMPQFKKSRLSNMKLVRVNDAKVLLIMVADSGVVKTMQLSLTNSTQDALDSISKCLLDRLEGSTIEDINLRMLNRLKADLPQYNYLIDYLIPIMRDILDEFDEVDVYVEGANKVLDTSEFQDINMVKRILEILDDKEKLFEILKNTTDQGINIKIGIEIGVDELEECSIISAVYRLDDSHLGCIGILGSKRMEYGNVISAVSYVKETLTEIFSGINL